MDVAMVKWMAYDIEEITRSDGSDSAWVMIRTGPGQEYNHDCSSQLKQRDPRSTKCNTLLRTLYATVRTERYSSLQ